MQIVLRERNNVNKMSRNNDNKKDNKDEDTSDSGFLLFIVLIFIFGLVVGVLGMLVFVVGPIHDERADCNEVFNRCVSGYNISINEWGKCVQISSILMDNLTDSMIQNYKQNKLIELQNELIMAQENLINVSIDDNKLHRSNSNLYQKFACDCYNNLSEYTTVSYDVFPYGNECK